MAGGGSIGGSWPAPPPMLIRDGAGWGEGQRADQGGGADQEWGQPWGGAEPTLNGVWGPIEGQNPGGGAMGG